MKLMMQLHLVFGYQQLVLGTLVSLQLLLPNKQQSNTVSQSPAQVARVNFAELKNQASVRVTKRFSFLKN